MVTTTQGDVPQIIRSVLLSLEETFTKVTLSGITTKDRTRIQTRLQTIFGLRFGEPQTSLVHQTIMTHALQAEKLGPGGFEQCIQNVLDLWRGQSTLEDLKGTLRVIEESGTQSATVHDLETIVSGLTSRLQFMLRAALDLCGFGGRIFVEKAVGSQPSVELITGFTFPLQPVYPVQAQLTEPRVACIDGFIESVSEIHALLTSLVDSKSTALLFVRGLHDEVRHTLKVNHDRGILKVYPFIVPFDLEGINTLADLATLSNGDVTSSTKGQLISLLTVSDLPVIEKATVYNDRVVIVNKSSRQRVKSHINALKAKRDTYSDESLTRLIDLRIRSLSPNQVMIRLPDNERYAVDAQSIDQALRNVRSMVDHGTLNGKPAAAQAAGVMHAIKCWETLASLGAIVKL